MGVCPPNPVFPPLPVLLLPRAAARSFEQKSVASIVAALQRAGSEHGGEGGGREPPALAATTLPLPVLSPAPLSPGACSLSPYK